MASVANRSAVLASNDETNQLPFDKELLQLELDKIRLFIDILTEHEEKCEKDERFPEAAVARMKINLLKQIEEAKILADLKEMQNDQLQKVQESLHEEKDELLMNYNKNRKDLEDNCNLMIEHLKSKQSEEEDVLVEAFDNKYPSQPKFSPEVLSLQKKMEAYVKNKEYEKANETKIKIIQLCSEQDNKWKTETHDKKLQFELKKLRSKHEKELNKLKLKINRVKDEFEKVHNEEVKMLDLKLKNKVRILISEHIMSENSFKKPSKHMLIRKIGA